MTVVTGRQITAARALLGWRVADLASATGLHRNTLSAYERQTLAVGNAGRERIVKALHAAGVELTDRGAQFCEGFDFEAVTAKVEPAAQGLDRRADDVAQLPDQTPAYMPVVSRTPSIEELRSRLDRFLVARSTPTASTESRS